MQLQIPKLHYVSQGKTPEDHLKNIQSACSYGAELVQLRLKGYSDKTILATAQKAREITNHFQTRLIINDYYKVAKLVNADGVHLGKGDTAIKVAREFLGPYFIIGGSANTLQDCEDLLKKEIDYIGLGPFKFTNTKKVLSPVLGKDGYAAIIDVLQTNTPIIAIGGITLDNISEILETGINGIAVAGEITNDFNNIKKFNEILKGPSTEEQVWKPNQKK